MRKEMEIGGRCVGLGSRAGMGLGGGGGDGRDVDWCGVKMWVKCGVG